MSDDKFGQVEGTTLKKFVLVRKLYLHEHLIIGSETCRICDLYREIVYWGSYDRDKNVECFNICELCAKDLISGSIAILHSLGVV